MQNGKKRFNGRSTGLSAQRLTRYGSHDLREIRIQYLATAVVGTGNHLAKQGIDNAQHFVFGPLSITVAEVFDTVYQQDRFIMAVAGPDRRPTPEEATVAAEKILPTDRSYVIQLVRDQDPPNVLRVLQVPTFPNVEALQVLTDKPS